MRSRRINLVSFLGERVVANCYKNSKLIICGLCGNLTPEENYLNNDCPHCFMGIDYESESEGSDELTNRLEESFNMP